MPLRTQYEELVLRDARRYARMKLHGVVIVDGIITYFSNPEREVQTKYLLEVLERSAKKLLLVMAIDEENERLSSSSPATRGRSNGSAAPPAVYWSTLQ